MVTIRRKRKNWRIAVQTLDRMSRLLAPRQTETDWVESALYEKAVRDEEYAKANGEPPPVEVREPIRVPPIYGRGGG